MVETFIFDLFDDDKAFINIYHDEVDNLVYTMLQVESKNGNIIDNQVMYQSRL